MTESGASISEWAETTFGHSGSDARVAARANEEMAELLSVICGGEWNPAPVAEECADVAIVLCRLANRCGVDLFEEIDRKMAINRERKWVLDGTGHGYHVPEESGA